MTTPASAETFFAAAFRHYQDAQLLRGQERLPNADHLAGIAAECGLKAVLTSYLGGYIDEGNRPNHRAHPRGSKKKDKHEYGHLPTLWDEIAVVSSGRSGSTFHQAMPQENPFHQWDVAERYAEGSHIDVTRADQHLAAARKVLPFYEEAKITGVLP
ncbi:hypothetical protein ABT324_21805 [Saccharopolyspora sp. NPDC000359]|uniref:hypothetical protein n=1 Tax=Saccharopolyspora sp. NPDC000359 TaxID=3154251 RepID=UPI00331F50A5